MKNKEDVLKYLRDEGEMLEIPGSLEPEQMKRKLKQHSAQKSAKKHKVRRFYKNIVAAAACLCVVGLGAFAFTFWNGQEGAQMEVLQNDGVVEAPVSEQPENEMEYPGISYEDIYASMSAQWEKSYGNTRNETGILTDGTAIVKEPGDAPVEEDAAAEYFAEAEKLASAESVSDQHGETNVQTVGVDEGDIVKNDGRYLYQKIQVEEENLATYVIQIIDTKDGLKELARIDGIDGIAEFYIWEDVLVVVEEKYLEETTSYVSGGMAACYDVKNFGNEYHEITFFDITDRSQPKEMKRFTLQGQYMSSRITDGYFYGFSKYYAEPGEGESDYDAYIPVIDGKRMAADRIYLPEENDATTYLVLVSIDLKNPTKFADTTGIVSDGNLYYVSSENIFVADKKEAERVEGWSSDSTKLLRFSYKDGKFALHAMGEVKGHLESSFSMDEQEDHLRVVTTVNEYRSEKVSDDRTGEVIGWNTFENRKSNALYVLDKALEVVGKIEGLAEDEQIYSARFMGDIGYFVTFRQTDPLFTVDLSNPKAPKILSELKISGFSEYLHIYGEDRLLGIGMEVDEETGIMQGMKLSMFDVSDKSNVTEIAKKNLTEYDYSEALYNHRAVMISVGKNIFGFEAEGYENGYYRDYFVYTYENDKFVQRLKLSMENEDGEYYSARGTFIGDTFYLLLGDGTVRSYDLNTGEKLESLEP